MSQPVIQRALISVSDKTGLIEFAQALVALGIELVSTGGSAKALAEAGLPVTPVENVTQFPEMLSGRVKTLHPHIHAGILARGQMDAEVLEQHGIEPFGLVVVNLYPFANTIAKADCTLADAIENIDIGGPTMVRAAAKNFNQVAILTNPKQYQAFLDGLNADNQLDSSDRLSFAREAFAHTAHYDALIAEYLAPKGLPETLSMPFTKISDLRYGENPHQQAAVYKNAMPHPGGFAESVCLQGKPLSYNNLADGNAAWACLSDLPSDKPSCVIVKHANPCGVASAGTLTQAYQRAFETDPTSAFGGIIAFNQAVSRDTLQAIYDNQFVEVILAPDFEAEALALGTKKPNVRLIRMPSFAQSSWHFQPIAGGMLVQEQDKDTLTTADFKVVSKAQPSQQDLAEALFAWRVCQHVKSNAIVYTQDQQTLGVGAGQMSRIFSARIAEEKASEAKLSLKGSVMASDAFFPFADSVETAEKAGVSVIVQPGGSIRDAEVIEAADRAGIVLLFTGTRHFKH